jgi:2-methylcitrate dehydratase
MAKLPKGRGAMVEVILADGTSLRETVEVPEGDPMRPLSRASLERKFLAFAIPALGDDGAKRVLALVNGLEDVKDIKTLMQALMG